MIPPACTCDTQIPKEGFCATCKGQLIGSLDVNDQEVIERFDEIFQQGNQPQTFFISTFRLAIREFIKEALHQRKEALLETIKELRRENKRTEKWSDDYYHALDDLKARITNQQ